MPCPHNEITIVQRSQRQSAVAAAAYQSGEKLFCEYDQQVKHYPEKRGIVHNEILLPANAPRSYADRNTLWNAAEAVEKQWNSQLARRWVLTIPREIPPDQYAVLVREFCQKQNFIVDNTTLFRVVLHLLVVCRPQYLMERRRSGGKAMELPACKAVGAYHSKRDTTRPVCCPCPGIL